MRPRRGYYPADASGPRGDIGDEHVTVDCVAEGFQEDFTAEQDEQLA